MNIKNLNKSRNNSTNYVFFVQLTGPDKNLSLASWCRAWSWGNSCWWALWNTQIKVELEEEGQYLKSKFDELNSKHERILRVNREVEEETQRLNSEYKSLDDDKFEILVNTNEFVTEEGSELLKVFLYQIPCKSFLIA